MKLALLLLLGLPGCQCSSECPVSDRPVDLRVDRAPTDAGPEFLPTVRCVDTGKLRTVDVAPSLPVTPAIKWTRSIDASGELTSAIIGLDGEIVVANPKAGVLAADSDGTPLWSIGWPGDAWLYGYDDPTTLASRIVFSSNDEVVVLVWPKGGAGNIKSIKGPLADDQMTKPVRLGPDRFLVGASDGQLYDMEVGVAGSRQIHIGGGKPLDIVADGQGSVYVISSGAANEIVAVDLASGSVRWRRRLGGAKSQILTLALDGQEGLAVGVIPDWTQYVTDIVMLDRACGAARWRHSTQGMLRPPILVDADGDVVYGLTLNRKAPDAIERLGPGGVLRWRTEIELDKQLELGTIGVIGADGALQTSLNYAGTGDWPPGQEPRLRAYSPSGRILWELLMPRTILSITRAPLLLDDGSLIIGVKHHPETSLVAELRLVAIQTPSPGLAHAPWPRRWHDNLNSSNLAGPTP